MQHDQVLYASEVSKIDEFDSLEGDAKYLGRDYADNYYLDIEKTDMFDTGEKVMNSIANALFSFYKVMSKLICSIFYFSMKFDINDILGTQINGIQNALKSSIFTPLFTLAFAGAAFIMIKRMIKRDISGVLGEMGKVIVLVVLSCMVVTKSSIVLSNTTKATKEVATGILIDMNTEMGIEHTSGTSYAAEAAGVLWVNLIHEPWKSLEFGTSNPDAETIRDFLSTKPGSNKRKELVEDYEQKNEGTFDKAKGASSIGMLFAYFIPFVIKGALYIIVAVIQLVFQLIALFLMILAPIILLLAMMPGYEGIVTSWLKKMLETQISILVITFIMALMIKLDMSLYNMIPQLGWYTSIFLQVGLSIGLFLGRNKVLQLFINIQKGIGNPNMLQRQLRMTGNPYKGIQNIQSGIKRTQFVSSKGTGATQKKQSDKVKFVYPTNGNNDRQNREVKVERPVLSNPKVTVAKRETQQSKSTMQHPDYYATETQYNTIDTSNLHEIWENAVPRPELNRKGEQYGKITQSPVAISSSPNESNGGSQNRDKKEHTVTRPVSFTKPLTKGDSRLKSDDTSIISKTVSVSHTTNEPSERPKVVKDSRERIDSKDNQQGIENAKKNTESKVTDKRKSSHQKKGNHLYNSYYTSEEQNRPILLNGKPKEEKKRPVTKDNSEKKSLKVSVQKKSSVKASKKPVNAKVQFKVKE